jgi:hypothetical protein
VDDIVDMRAICRDLQYDEVCVLVDGSYPVGAFDPADFRLPDPAAPGQTTQTPTRANILAAGRWLVEGASTGDILLFHYSGHGGLLKALVAGSEPTGYDETLVPMDYTTAGEIRDDDLRALLVEPVLGTGAYLRVVFDSCHSGTGLDLKYNLADTTPVRVIGGGRAAEAEAPGVPGTAPARGNARRAPARALARQASSPQCVADGEAQLREWGRGEEGALVSHAAFLGRPGRDRGSASDSEVCLVSGCADEQTSADATFNRRPGGALTHSLVCYLRKQYRVTPAGPSATWPTALALLHEVRKTVRAAGFRQVPQFSSEEPITPQTRFNLT